MIIHKKFTEAKDFFFEKNVLIVLNSARLLKFEQGKSTVGDTDTIATYKLLEAMGANPCFSSEEPEDNIRKFGFSAIDITSVTQDQYNKFDAIVLLSKTDFGRFKDNQTSIEHLANLVFLSEYDKPENVFVSVSDPKWRPQITDKFVDTIEEQLPSLVIDFKKLRAAAKQYGVLISTSIDVTTDPREFITRAERTLDTNTENLFPDYLDRRHFIFPLCDMNTYTMFEKQELDESARKYDFMTSNLMQKSSKRIRIVSAAVEKLFNDGMYTLTIGQYMTSHTTKALGIVPQSELFNLIDSSLTTLEIGDDSHNGLQVKVSIAEALKAKVLPFIWHELDPDRKMFSGLWYADYLYVENVEELSDKIRCLTLDPMLYKNTYLAAMNGFADRANSFFKGIEPDRMPDFHIAIHGLDENNNKAQFLLTGNNRLQHPEHELNVLCITGNACTGKSTLVRNLMKDFSVNVGEHSMINDRYATVRGLDKNGWNVFWDYYFGDQKTYLQFEKAIEASIRFSKNKWILFDNTPNFGDLGKHVEKNKLYLNLLDIADNILVLENDVEIIDSYELAKQVRSEKEWMLDKQMHENISINTKHFKKYLSQHYFSKTTFNTNSNYYYTAEQVAEIISKISK